MEIMKMKLCLAVKEDSWKESVSVKTDRQTGVLALGKGWNCIKFRVYLLFLGLVLPLCNSHSLPYLLFELTSCDNK